MRSLLSRTLLLPLLKLAVVVTSVFLFQNSIHIPDQASAAQCWDPGCCGFNLTVNQWSCQNSTSVCAGWQNGEIAGWYCSYGGSGYPTQQSCLNYCGQLSPPGTCSYGCPSGWAQQCVITQGSVACSHPDPNTCSATINATTCTSQNSGTSCSVGNGGSETRSCWVSGTPSSPPPPPPPGGGTTCWRCVNSAACQETTSNEPCGCASCTTQSSKKAVFLFEDIDEDGNWEPAQGEKRITSRSDCLTSNTKHLPGAAIKVGSDVYQDNCNVGNSEFTGNTCTWTDGPCNGGTATCSTWGWEWMDVAVTCFSEHSCSTGCHWSWAACSGESADEKGRACSAGVCDNTTSSYMKTGPYRIISKDTGFYTLGAQLPSGWRVSTGSPTAANWVNTNGSCDGLVGIGVVEDIQKTCTISPVERVIGNTAPNNIATFSLFAQSSSQTPENVTVGIVTKNPGATGAPTSIIVSPQPNTMTHAVYSGRHYYYPTGVNCSTGSNTPCYTTVSVTGLPVGDYYVFCAMNTDNGALCSGNPNCSYEGLGGGINCSATGYESCTMPQVQDPNIVDDNARITVQCVKQCTLSCGQNDQCGSTCPTTGSVTPSTPSPSPASGNVTVSGTDTITVNWSSVTNATRYDIIAHRQSVSFNESQLDAIFDQCLSSCTGTWINNKCSITYSGTQVQCSVVVPPTHTYTTDINHTNEIKYSVRATNATCFGLPSGVSNSNWVTRDYDLVQNITGHFHNAQDLGGGNYQCNSSPIYRTPPPASTTVDLVAQQSGQVIQTLPVPSPAMNSTSYNLGNVPYSPSSWGTPKYTLQLNLPPPPDPANALTCHCPDGCAYYDVSSPPAPGATVHFFFKTVDLSVEPWWQIANGLLYAASGTVQSDIPQQCLDDYLSGGTCIPYLITRDSSGLFDDSSSETAGVPMAGSGSISTGDIGQYLTDRQPQLFTSEPTSHSNLDREDFEYFQSRVDYDNLTTLPTISGVVVGQPALTDDPTIYKHTGDLTIRPSDGSTWAVDGNEALIIFVDGNLTIDGSSLSTGAAIQVKTNGFLGFIVNGSIIFNESVGNSDPAASDTNVEGLYVADNSIVIEANPNANIADKKFIGAGTFVAWDQDGSGGIQLNRNYADSGDGALENHTNPTEMFLFRPDMLINIPVELQSTDVLWQEVN